MHFLAERNFAAQNQTRTEMGSFANATRHSST
jgi:hypothetical protein